MGIRQGFNRRRFLGLGALAAGAGLEGLIGHADFAAASAGGAIQQPFLYKKADYRQIWDFTLPEQIQLGCGPMKNAMNAFEQAYHKSHYLLINLRGSAVIFALDDEMWAKYKFGPAFQIFDPKVGGLAHRNPLYARTTTDNGSLAPTDSKSLYQDSSLQALQKRGAHISACGDALGGVAVFTVQNKRAGGLTAAQVRADFVQHLVPGALTTPSGSSLIAVAQVLGFTYAKQ